MQFRKKEANNPFIEREWNAQWIWHEKDSSSNMWMCFRKDIELPEGINSARAWVAAETKYWLWLNGRQVVFEGGLNRGPEPGRGYYDVVDLKNYLKRGVNTLAVLVWYWGNEGRNNADSGKGGLLFEAQFDDIRVCSDSSWLLTVHPAYGSTEDPQPSYLYGGHNIGFDARKDITGWVEKVFNCGTWENANEKGVCPSKPWGVLEQRPVPMIRDCGIKEYVELINEKNSIVRAVLPYAAQITPWFKVNSEAEGIKIDIRTDRYYVNGGPGDSHNVYRGHRTEYITRKGIQDFEALDWLFGEEVLYSLPEGVEVISLGYRETGYNCSFSGSFKCSDAFLNRLYDKCRRTLYVCMRDNYMDCPDRERGQWIGDVSSQVPQTFYALDRSSDLLTVKAIRDFVRWREGKISLNKYFSYFRIKL